MSAHYQIVHDTRYCYDSPVSLAKQLAHLWPRPCAWQRCHEQALLISPEPTRRTDELDVFGNPLTRLAFERPHDELKVGARLHVEVLPRTPPEFALSPSWELTRDALCYSGQALGADVLQACRYRFESPYVRLKKSFVAFSASCFPPGRPMLEGAQALMQKIFGEFTFDATATQVATPLVEVLENRRGVCQGLRTPDAGLPALARPGGALRQRLPADPAAARATADDRCRCLARLGVGVLSGAGLVDFDPTNNVQPGLEHITLAWGRDFSDVSPLRGVILGGGGHDPEVRVTVLPMA